MTARRVADLQSPDVPLGSDAEGLSHGHSSCRFRTWAVTVGSSTQGVFESQPLLLLGFLLCPFVQALP